MAEHPGPGNTSFCGKDGGAGGGPAGAGTTGPGAGRAHGHHAIAGAGIQHRPPPRTTLYHLGHLPSLKSSAPAGAGQTLTRIFPAVSSAVRRLSSAFSGWLGEGRYETVMASAAPLVARGTG